MRVPPTIRENSARRKAVAAAALLVAAVYIGSGRLSHFDPALAGYLAAVIISVYAIARRVADFWHRPPSAFYGLELFAALGHPRTLLQVARLGGRDLAAQRFLGRRSVARGIAHLLLSWGTVVGFGVTLPLVFGWLRFEADAQRLYRVLILSVPLARFDVHGIFGWLVFHALDVSAVAVVLGTSYFLALRLRSRHPSGGTNGFHLAPLVILLAVATTGLGLPLAARSGIPWLFCAAQLCHEAAVVALLVMLPYGKLQHLFIRPLHLGVGLFRARSEVGSCGACGAPHAPQDQLEAVESMLAAHGFRFGGHQRLCPACRRRRLSATQAYLLGMEFQPRATATRVPFRRAA